MVIKIAEVMGMRMVSGQIPLVSVGWDSMEKLPSWKRMGEHWVVFVGKVLLLREVV